MSGGDVCCWNASTCQSDGTCNNVTPADCNNIIQKVNCSSISIDDGQGCICKPANPCDLKKCQNDSVCTSTGDSYSCACKTGYYGDNCEHKLCGGKICGANSSCIGDSCKCDNCYEPDTSITTSSVVTTITSIQIIANVIRIDYSHDTPAPSGAICKPIIPTCNPSCKNNQQCTCSTDNKSICITSPGGIFPKDGLCIYYFIGNCESSGVSKMPWDCLKHAAIIMIAFANYGKNRIDPFINDELREENFGDFYDTAKELRNRGFKGIIMYSIGGQTGSNVCNAAVPAGATSCLAPKVELGVKVGNQNPIANYIYNFFCVTLTKDNAKKYAEQVAQWQIVDGIDFDIEHAEGAQTDYYWGDDNMKNRIVPFFKEVKNLGRPVTTTCEGTYLNEDKKTITPYWFSNLDGCIGSGPGGHIDMITNMQYPNEIIDIPTKYVDNMILKVPANTSMVNKYPNSLNKILYDSSQIATGIGGNAILKKENLSTILTNIKNNNSCSYGAVWAIAPIQGTGSCLQNNPGNCLLDT